MASLLGSPYASPLLLNTGLGLLAASQPTPYGQNRYAPVVQGLNAGLDQIQRMKQLEMQQELFSLKKEQMEEQKRERNSMLGARSTLLGGYDPNTEITWDTGRQGMSPQEQMGQLAQAAPEQVVQGLIQEQFPDPVKMTTAQKNALALGLTPGSPEYNKYMLAATLPKPSQTNVNVDNRGNLLPKPKEGFTYRYDKNGNVMTDENGLPMQAPIPGGPADITEQEKREKTESRTAQQKRYADIVTNDIDRAMNIIENSTIPVTGLGSVVAPIPGTPAHNATKLLDTIRANVGFDRLQQMRAASPTGGALGQVSNLENRLLQSTLGNLELTQGEEQLKYNLRRLKLVYEEIVNGLSGIDAKTNPEEWVSHMNEKLSELSAPKEVKRLKFNPETGGFE